MIIKYFSILGILFCSALSYASDCDIILGVNRSQYKPYSWINKSGDPEGLNIELFRAMVGKVGCDYQIIVQPWHELIQSFKDGEVDVIVSSLSPFKNSYKGNALVLSINIAFYGNVIYREGSQPIKSINDLSGKIVLVQEKSVSHDYLDSLPNRETFAVLPYSSFRDVVDSLSAGIGDLSMSSMTAILNNLDREIHTNLRVANLPFFPATYGFLFRPSAVKKYELMSFAMNELILDGAYFAIIQKWLRDEDKTTLWITRILSATALIFLVVLFILIWNKTLQNKVQKQTKALNDEIIQRKVIEEENIKLRDEALIASKFALLGEMASCLVHEINNPTGVIIHNIFFLTNLLEEYMAIAEDNIADIQNRKFCGMPYSAAVAEYHDAVGAIQESLFGISDTIKDLKEYGREQPDCYKTVELKECLSIAVKLSNYFVKHYTKNFSVEIVTGDYKIYGNMLHLEQLLVNLIQNSCYALENTNGRITCTLAPHLEKEQQYAKLSVADTGKGMSEEVKTKLFTPFFTTRKESGGTGLGLHIVQKIIKEHNGYIQLKSEEGVGTVISIFLPLDDRGV